MGGWPCSLNSEYYCILVKIIRYFSMEIVEFRCLCVHSNLATIKSIQTLNVSHEPRSNLLYSSFIGFLDFFQRECEWNPFFPFVCFVSVFFFSIHINVLRSKILMYLTDELMSGAAKCVWKLSFWIWWLFECVRYYNECEIQNRIPVNIGAPLSHTHKPIHITIL